MPAPPRRLRSRLPPLLLLRLPETGREASEKPVAQKAVEAGGLALLAGGAWKAANSPLGRQIVRGLMGAFFGGRRR